MFSVLRELHLRTNDRGGAEARANDGSPDHPLAYARRISVAGGLNGERHIEAPRKPRRRPWRASGARERLQHALLARIERRRICLDVDHPLRSLGGVRAERLTGALRSSGNLRLSRT